MMAPFLLSADRATSGRTNKYTSKQLYGAHIPVYARADMRICALFLVEDVLLEDGLLCLLADLSFHLSPFELL